MKLNRLLQQINNINTEELTKKLIELIVDKIKEHLKKDYYYHRLILRNLEILNIDQYIKMIKSGEINPEDTFVYFTVDSTRGSHEFYYLFIDNIFDLLDIFLSKLGFRYKERYIFPATGLKYIGIVRYGYNKYGDRYLTIEVADLDTVAKNTNLYDITSRVLNDKLRNEEKELTREEYNKILNLFGSQKLFASYSFGEACDILFDYYYYHNKHPSLERISEDYIKIFQPYKVCYYRENLEKIDCMSIGLIRWR